MAESQEQLILTETESDCDFEPQSKKRKSYKQKYNSSWEKNPQLKKWLCPVKGDPYSAHCKICNKNLIAGLSELQKHQLGKKHKEKEAAVVCTRSIREMVTSDSEQELVKRAEIKMASFIAEHNLPFSVMDHLSDLVKEAFPDSAIAKQFKSKRTKTRCIIKNVLAVRFRSDTVEALKNSTFSIIIDESTDVSCKKQLAVVVRYFCEKQVLIRSQFLCLIEVTNSDATSLTNTLVSFFEKNNIPLTNIIGYASDTTNVMFGEYHSVVTLLKEKLPNLFVMKCLCHSAHLCASHACEKLPRSIENLVRDIYSHFSHSAKRLQEYKTFQHFTKTEPHKLLKPAQTRWLSLEQCVQRVLEQWPALEAYFKNSAENDRLLSYMQP